MVPQDWESPAMVAAPTGMPYAGSTEIAAAYAMRPLSTGEVLDRTFSIYRSRFWLFAGIASVSGAVQLVANAFNLLGQHLVMSRYGFRTATASSSVGSLVGVLLFFLAVSVTQAATVHALSEVYLGREATLGGSLRPAMGLWYRYLGIALWQIWSAIWLGLLLAVPATVLFFPQLGLTSMAWLGGFFIFLALIGGTAYGVIAYIRNSLAVQAAVVEQSAGVDAAEQDADVGDEGEDLRRAAHCDSLVLGCRCGADADGVLYRENSAAAACDCAGGDPGNQLCGAYSGVASGIDWVIAGVLRSARTPGGL
jgi:hypothetical protein